MVEIVDQNLNQTMDELEIKSQAGLAETLV